MIKISTTRGFRFLVIAIAMLGPGLVPARAERIEGTIVIRKKLTKRRVTAQVPMYQRGPAVELSADREVDPLAFERSRVAVYLEGRFPPQAAAPAKKPAVAKMEQTNRRFSPETVVIQAGSKVSFPNDDPIFHNVFSLSGPKTFDLGNYPQGDTRMVMFPGTRYCVRQLPFASEYGRDYCRDPQQMEYAGRSRWAGSRCRMCRRENTRLWRGTKQRDFSARRW